MQQTHHVQVKEENEPTTYSLFTVHSELQDAMTVELTMNGIPVTLGLPRFLDESFLPLQL